MDANGILSSTNEPETGCLRRRIRLAPVGPTTTPPLVGDAFGAGAASRLVALPALDLAGKRH
jgi:hypothetical protein